MKRAKISNDDDVIDMATLTLSQFEENESDDEVYFQFWIIFFGSFITKSLLCWDDSCFIPFIVWRYIFSFNCDVYTLMLYFSRNLNLYKFYNSGKILFYAYAFLIKTNF